MRALGAVYEPGGLRPFVQGTRYFPRPPPHLLVQAVAPYGASLISPVQRNDPYNDSHYILHGTLILAVRPH